MTPGEIAGIAAVASAAVNALPLFVRWALGSRLSNRKVSLEEIRQRTEDLDSSYQRLEKENLRLAKRVDDLEETLTNERGIHVKTQERCRTLEEQLRDLGQRIRNLPPNGQA